MPPLISTRLREALGGEGCALCRVAADDLARFFSFLVEEGWRWGETAQALRDALGFCVTHMRTLAAAAPPEVVGVISGEVADAAIARLRQFLSAFAAASVGPVGRLLRRRHLKAVRDALARRGRCLACQRVVETEKSMAAELVRALEAEAVPAATRTDPGSACGTSWRRSLRVRRRCRSGSSCGLSASGSFPSSGTSASTSASSTIGTETNPRAPSRMPGFAPWRGSAGGDRKMASDTPPERVEVAGLPSCEFRRRRVRRAADGMDLDVIVCVAAGGKVLAEVGGDEAGMRAVCGLCPIPQGMTFRPCLYLVPLKIEREGVPRDYYDCRWFYRRIPRSPTPAWTGSAGAAPSGSPGPPSSSTKTTIA